MASQLVDEKSLSRMTAWPRTRSMVFMLVVCSSAVMVILYVTPFGIGASPDSVVYMVGARSLAAGAGFSLPTVDGQFRLITHHAPFYSLMLSVGELFGLGSLLWGRILNALLFAGSLLLTFQISQGFAARENRDSDLISLLIVGLLLTPFFVLQIHAMAWSEPMFIFLFLISLKFSGDYLEKPSYIKLIAAGLAAGAALLTRYAGGVLLISFGLAILLFSRQNLRQRWLGALLFGALAAAPLAFWLVRNVSETGTTTNREIFFHPFGKAQISQAMTTMSSWILVPQSAPMIIKALVLSVVVGGVACLLWRKMDQIRRSGSRTPFNESLPGIVLILLILIPFYFLFLGLSLTFFDANIPMNGRIFVPVYVSFLIVLSYLIHQFVPTTSVQRLLKSSLLLLGLALILGNAFSSYPFMKTARQRGLGFDSPIWQGSALIAALKNFPQELAIYTNVPEPILLYTNRGVEALPRKVDLANQQTNPNYSGELETILQRVLAGEAIIVYFNTLDRSNLPSESEIRSVPGILILENAADGIVIAAKALQ